MLFTQDTPDGADGRVVAIGHDDDGFCVSVVAGDGHETVVKVSGELDVLHSPRLREVLTDAIDGTAYAHFVLDLADVSFIDSTALAVLAGASRRVRDRGGKLVVTEIQPKVH